MENDNRERLVKFLSSAGAASRRAAGELVKSGRVTVNGRVARASYEVKEGDVIAIRFGERTLTVEVLSVQDNVGKDAAALLYREIQA